MTAKPNPKPLEDSIRPQKKLAFAALHHKDFRAYFITTMLAMMADNIEHVISYWLLYEKFQSPVLAGFAVLSHWTPFLLFAVYFGAMADRFDCRKVIQVAQFMFMGVSAAWAVLFWTDTIEVWHACVLLVIHGMAGVLWGPGSQLLIHDIVGREQLQSAIRLNSTSRQLGILFGPAVGGGLMLLLSPAAGLVVNTLIYLPLTIWLLTVPYTGHSREDVAPARRAISWRDAFQIIREVSSNRPIITMIALGGCVSFFVGTAFQATMPEFAHDLGTEKADFAYSALLGANAAGAVVGGFLLEGRGWLPPSVRTAIISAILWCVVIATFALSTSYSVSLALLFVAGVLNLAFSSMAQTIVQLRSPPQLRGRLIGLYAMASMGLKAFSGVTVGVAGGLIGVHWSLALSAMVLLAITLALFAFATPGQQGESLAKG
ncbi:MAG TPA: MFS transporter [Candidatus Binatia bacterium]|jgi:MFS family permease